MAPIAKRERAAVIEAVQKITCCFIDHSINPSPGFTSIESLQERQLSKFEVTEDPAL